MICREHSSTNRFSAVSRPVGALGRALLSTVLLSAAASFALSQAERPAASKAESVGNAEARARLEQRMKNQNRWLKLEWRSRTTMYTKGRRRASVEHEVEYELSGTFARTRVTPLGSVGTPGNFKSNFVGGREEEALDWMDRLNDVVDLYFRVSPGQALEFLAEAEVSDEADAASSSRRFEGESYALPGDRVTLFVDAETDLPRALQVRTALGGEPLILQLEMRVIEGGVNVPSRAVVQVPGERVRMSVEFFGYGERALR